MLTIFYFIYGFALVMYIIFFYIVFYHFNKYEVKHPRAHPVLVVFFILSVLAIVSTFVLSFT